MAPRGSSWPLLLAAGVGLLRLRTSLGGCSGAACARREAADDVDSGALLQEWTHRVAAPALASTAAAKLPAVPVAGSAATAAAAAASSNLAQVPAITPEFLEGAIPVLAIVIGLPLTQSKALRTVGLLSVYFGVQLGLNIYMKAVMSEAVISSERGMKGVPGAFFITAVQQLVALAMLLPVLAVLWFTPWRYVPKPVSSWRALVGIFGLSAAFALNIGLNNLSLSLLPMSINLMIRSCTPLAVWMLQALVSAVWPGQADREGSSALEVGMMVLGVFFAALASLAKEEGAPVSEAKNMAAGLIVAGLSLAAAALYMLLAQWLGRDAKLNPVDMALYMSLPAASFLLPFILCLPHPVAWPGYGAMTDLQVLREVARFSPTALYLVGLSGVFAVSLNILQYTMLHELSATHSAFAGNFNKAAAIVVSLALGLESLPDWPWGGVSVLAIAGGIGSFTAFSILRAQAGQAKQQK